MERLTMNNGICQMASTEFCLSQKDCYSCPHGRKCFKRLAAYEDAMHLERAQELAQAEKDGRLVVLPYKIGDFVCRIAVRKKYLNHSMDTPYIKVVEVKTKNALKYKSEIGKTVFLTREEAEAALKKREADNEAD